MPPYFTEIRSFVRYPSELSPLNLWPIKIRLSTLCPNGRSQKGSPPSLNLTTRRAQSILHFPQFFYLAFKILNALPVITYLITRNVRFWALKRRLKNRSLRALGIPLLLGVSTCASYSFAPLAPTAESIYQALWLSTGISLLTALAQSLIENTEEVFPSPKVRQLTEERK